MSGHKKKAEARWVMRAGIEAAIARATQSNPPGRRMKRQGREREMA